MSSSFRRKTRRPLSSTKSPSSESFPNSKLHHDSSLSQQPATSRTSPTHASLQAVFERVGTKPWIGGLSLTSTGLREFDAILGGGQPLGTAILIEEDRWTQDLAFSLVRYWSAEGVAQKQTLSLAATLPNLDALTIAQLDTSSTDLGSLSCQQGMNRTGLQAFQRMLPRDLHLDKTKAKSDVIKDMEDERAKAEKQLADIHGNFGTIQEGDDGDEDFDEGEADDNVAHSDEGLKNAWQYKMSVQEERLGAPLATSKSDSRSGSKAPDGKTYCHSYDLSGRMEDQYTFNWIEDNDCMFIFDCCSKACPSFSCQNTRSYAMEFHHTCVKHIEERIEARPSTVVRMLVMNAPVEVMAISLPLLLRHIRENSLPVVLLLTVRPWLRPACSNAITSYSYTPTLGFTQSLVSLRRACDAVFTCEGFGAMIQPPPPEFSDIAGILSIKKMALQSLSHFADSTTSRRPPANRYGMKRDRRKMHVRLLHLPPEDFSAGGSSVGSGVRSGAGMPKKSENDESTKHTRTALQPGLGCATNMRSTAAASLEF